MTFKSRRVEIKNTYIELWFNNINYNITIGDIYNISNQHTVYTTTSETDAMKRYIALSNSFRDILG
ncbi:MAG: hypothetical protein RSC93_02220 [Erysipelotrichaceae bacterium]